jgi:hypothetical protein
MHASNKPDAPVAATFARLDPERAAAVRALWSGSAGYTVRCVPTRRTVGLSFAGGWLFGKWRSGALGDAAREWRWLHVLPLLGLRTPAPVAWIGRGSRSLLVTEGVVGQALDVWMMHAVREGWQDLLVAYLCDQVAPLVRQLHAQGLVYRDLYWNHLFVLDPRRFDPPVFLDVERVIHPRWRWRRWVIKDLAGLLASVPVEVTLPRRAVVRFLRAYRGGSLRDFQGTMVAIEAKARRIRGRRPKFG